MPKDMTDRDKMGSRVILGHAFLTVSSQISWREVRGIVLIIFPTPLIRLWSIDLSLMQRLTNRIVMPKIIHSMACRRTTKFIYPEPSQKLQMLTNCWTNMVHIMSALKIEIHIIYIYLLAHFLPAQLSPL